MSITSMLCRHTWYWSERHGADRCRRCGKLNEMEMSAVPEPAAPARAVPGQPFLLNSQRKSRSLMERLDLLKDGADLSRDEILQTVVDLIEEAQTARPRLTADTAARYCAALEGARRAAH
jgi:hypothetical protein